MLRCAVSVSPLFTLTCDGPNMAASLVKGALFGPEYGRQISPIPTIPWAPR